MRAKQTFAWIAVAAVAVVSGLVCVHVFRTGSALLSEPTTGRARLAADVHKARGQTRDQAGNQAAEELSPEAQAEEVVRVRNQLAAIGIARQRSQDQATLKRRARNAAAARLDALGKTTAEARRERDSRDAERDKYKGTPKEIARKLLPDHGWDQDDEWSCLEKLWHKESGWRVTADNPNSSAYGIAQALPGKRMASYGSDWRTNPVTQIKWGLDYIEDRYGSPCEAWSHSKAKGWY